MQGPGRDHNPAVARPGSRRPFVNFIHMTHEIYINRGVGYEWFAEIDADNLNDAEERLVKIFLALPPEVREGRYAIRPHGQRSCVLPEDWLARRLSARHNEQGSS